MVNEDRTSFVITVDKELFDQDPYSQLYANITMNTLVTLSTYVQAYNGIPVDEQTVKVIFLTDEGETILSNISASPDYNTLPKSEDIEEVGIEKAEDDSFQEIKIEPAYVALDDENAKIEFTSVSKEVMNLGTELEYTAYNVNYTITNKNAQNDLMVALEQGNTAIGPYIIDFNLSNNIAMAGKTNDTASLQAIKCKSDSRSSSNTAGIEHIERVNDLLQFEGELLLWFTNSTDNTTAERYEVEVSLADYISQQ